MDVVYTNTRAPDSFGGIETLRRRTGKPRKDVIKYLAGQDAYAMHRPTRRRFPRRRTYSKGIDDMFQIGLAISRLRVQILLEATLRNNLRQVV